MSLAWWWCIPDMSCIADAVFHVSARHGTLHFRASGHQLSVYSK